MSRSQNEGDEDEEGEEGEILDLARNRQLEGREVVEYARFIKVASWYGDDPRRV